jgi:hypothetical protein
MEVKESELALSGHSGADSAPTGFMHKTEGKRLGSDVTIDWLIIELMGRLAI